MKFISPINHSLLEKNNLQLDMLRLDTIHPAISGNKWFKLKYHLEDAREKSKKSLLSFGGAYSNHLHALAFAGKKYGYKTIAYVRGEEVSNPTLKDCKTWGMELHFISRAQYQLKDDEVFIQALQERLPESLIIPEGGKSEYGILGCREIMTLTDTAKYDIITCAIGTATTFIGISQSLLPHQFAIGYTAMKQGEYLHDIIVKNIQHDRWQLVADYHFGGFAKITDELKDYMQIFYLENDIELDRVYNAKMIAGLFDMIGKGMFEKGKKILAIHTGGLQGNRV
jgi:1-aminocyclopropane-1-carboxylate deaminase